MKKIYCALLALLMMITGTAALAGDDTETMETTVYVEGEPEDITLTRYESTLGYTIWYDAVHFDVSREGVVDTFLPTNGIDGVKMEIRALQDKGLEHYTTSLFPVMAEGGYDVSRMEAWDIDTPYPMAQLRSVKGDHLRMCFLMETGEGVFAFLMAYPQEAAEGFGARFVAMLNTFSVENG